jgi:hypothetical protein
MDKIIDTCNEYTYTTTMPSLVAAEDFLRTLTETEEDEEGVDLFYSTLIMAVRICIMRGWTPEQLLADVKHHADDEYADLEDKVN